ncbi:MAG: diguanylate cyclase [Planctomycetota bacterium]|nr:MAG: diguanylate cyclase [Planctomycetota bacterium]
MTARPLTIASADPETVAACREAARLAHEAVSEIRVAATLDELERAGAEGGQLVLDPALVQPHGVHEWTLAFLRRCRALVWILSDGDLRDADGLARFVGAQGAIARPIVAEALAERLASPFGAAPLRPAPIQPDDHALRASVDKILAGRESGERDQFVRTITEQDSGLFTLAYWEHRLDEEFKRSQRFRYPLGLAGFAFDGEVGEEALQEIAGVILLDTRDVDVVSRFDSRTFVALLPHTGPAGTRIFAERVAAELNRRGLDDLLGEKLVWRWATAVCPDTALPTPREFLAAVVRPLSGLPAQG